jgi:putative CocE/NonD family hydrolase
VEFNVPAQMRDGVTLRANVYRPPGPGPWPTLLSRHPYDKDDPLVNSFWLDPMKAAREGFMVVIQDTRGRLASDGEWQPLRFEREDGYDSVEWAARLPGSNGKVGMYGCSYFGNTQLMAAVEQPPSLGAIAPSVTWSDPLDGLFSRGGALEIGLALSWSLAMGAGYLPRLPLGSEELEQRITALLDDYDALPTKGFWELPVSDGRLLLKHEVPDLGTIRMLFEPDFPAFSRAAGEYERISVPSLHIGGWHDIFLQGTLDNYMGMAALGRPARLVIGPWAHDPAALSGAVGDLNFGIRSGAFGVPVHPEGDLGDLQLAWFRRYLLPDGDSAASAAEAPVRIFVMGRNEWRDEPFWPLERAHAERWFLTSGGALRSESPSPDGGSTGFNYDPAEPVPTVGGHISDIPTFPPGPRDQSSIEAREDLCVFTSEPLREDLEVTGPVRVVLHAESSAPSTDWVARLCDVHPDGRSFNLCDGILRAEVTEGVGRYEIDLWSTSNVFLAGHRLRVHLTSSSFPRWDRNLNTGNQAELRMQVARQRIHHSPEYPSWIELPVVPS